MITVKTTLNTTTAVKGERCLEDAGDYVPEQHEDVDEVLDQGHGQHGLG